MLFHWSLGTDIYQATDSFTESINNPDKILSLNRILSLRSTSLLLSTKWPTWKVIRSMRFCCLDSTLTVMDPSWLYTEVISLISICDEPTIFKILKVIESSFCLRLTLFELVKVCLSVSTADLKLELFG